MSNKPTQDDIINYNKQRFLASRRPVKATDEETEKSSTNAPVEQKTDSKPSEKPVDEESKSNENKSKSVNTKTSSKTATKKRKPVASKSQD